MDCADLVPATKLAPGGRSLVVSNPPWGMRLDGEASVAAWRGLGSFLRRECGGTSAWLLSGSPELTRELRMRAGSKLMLEQAGRSRGDLGEI